MIAHLLDLTNKYSIDNTAAERANSNPGVSFFLVSAGVSSMAVTCCDACYSGVAVGTISPFNPIIARFAKADVFASKYV